MLLLSSGLNYLSRSAPTPGKNRARVIVADLLSPKRYDGPRTFLSMPGIEGRLEIDLGQAGWSVTGVENDPDIFETIAGIPSFRRISESHLITPYGHLWHRELTLIPLTEVERVSVIWADFSGPLTEDRLDWLSSWWATARDAEIVILSFVVGRTRSSLGPKIFTSFPGGRPEHDLCYCDTQEMRQLAFARPRHMVRRRGQFSHARRLTCERTGCNRVALSAFGSLVKLCRTHADGKEPERLYGRQICSVPGCGRAHRAQGLCASHYENQRRVRTTGKAPKQRGGRGSVLIATDTARHCPMCSTKFRPRHMAKYCSEPCARVSWTVMKARPGIKFLITRDREMAVEKVRSLSDLGLLKLRKVAGMKPGRFSAAKRGKLYLVRWMLP